MGKRTREANKKYRERTKASMTSEGIPAKYRFIGYGDTDLPDDFGKYYTQTHIDLEHVAWIIKEAIYHGFPIPFGSINLMRFDLVEPIKKHLDFALEHTEQMGCIKVSIICMEKPDTEPVVIHLGILQYPKFASMPESTLNEMGVKTRP